MEEFFRPARRGKRLTVEKEETRPCACTHTRRREVEAEEKEMPALAYIKKILNSV